MSSRMKASFLKYGISVLVCGLFVGCYLRQHDFQSQALVEQYRILCDAFTVPGILAVMFGLLLAISNDGFFLGIAYCGDVMIKSLIPGGRLKIKKYYDFVQERKGKKVTGFGFLFVAGGICLAVAIVFMILFYRIY